MGEAGITKRIGDIEGSGVWLEEFDRADNIGKMVLMLGGVGQDSNG